MGRSRGALSSSATEQYQRSVTSSSSHRMSSHSATASAAVSQIHRESSAERREADSTATAVASTGDLSFALSDVSEAPPHTNRTNSAMSGSTPENDSRIRHMTSFDRNSESFFMRKGQLEDVLQRFGQDALEGVQEEGESSPRDDDSPGTNVTDGSQQRAALYHDHEEAQRDVQAASVPSRDEHAEAISAPLHASVVHFQTNDVQEMQRILASMSAKKKKLAEMLQDNIVTLAATSEERNDLRAEVEMLRGKLRAAQQVAHRTEKDRRVAAKTSTGLQAEIEDTRKGTDELVAENQLLRAENADLKVKLEATRAGHAELMGRVEAAEETAMMHTRETTEYLQEMRRMSENHAVDDGAMRAMRDELARVQRELQWFSQEREKLRRELQQQSRLRAQAEADTAERDTRIEHMEDDIAAMRERLAVLSESASAREPNAPSLDTALESLTLERARVRDLLTQVDALSADTKRWRARAHTAEDALSMKDEYTLEQAAYVQELEEARAELAEQLLRLQEEHRAAVASHHTAEGQLLHGLEALRERVRTIAAAHEEDAAVAERNRELEEFVKVSSDLHDRQVDIAARLMMQLEESRADADRLRHALQQALTALGAQCGIGEKVAIVIDSLEREREVVRQRSASYGARGANRAVDDEERRASEVERVGLRSENEALRSYVETLEAELAEEGGRGRDRPLQFLGRDSSSAPLSSSPARSPGHRGLLRVRVPDEDARDADDAREATALQQRVAELEGQLEEQRRATVRAMEKSTFLKKDIQQLRSAKSGPVAASGGSSILDAVQRQLDSPGRRRVRHEGLALADILSDEDVPHVSAVEGGVPMERRVDSDSVDEESTDVESDDSDEDRARDSSGIDEAMEQFVSRMQSLRALAEDSRSTTEKLYATSPARKFTIFSTDDAFASGDAPWPPENEP